ncbi:hypothetical protein QR680_013787 [Steinernema hermaphroditum]|uniref:SXP/RAL-2 family protein Ani s 5-like cation-binding domain-containing protein n=1 Tax=Steinernema hermaphroditum TaxID=289476 RepID=A0AA39M2Y7_9BILA|nr:hypothetical protein QR680_013787 [Steinernema hermaphroditum]
MAHFIASTLVVFLSFGLSTFAKPLNETDTNSTFIPEHNEVFALFMEAPWLTFIKNLTAEEIRALETFKTQEHKPHYTDEQFSEGLGRQSKTAQAKFDKMLIENRELEKGLMGKAKTVVEEIDNSFKDMDEDFSREDLQKWLIKFANKLSKLTEDEKDSIINTLPNKGLLLSRTGLLKVQTVEEAEQFIGDMIKVFGRWALDDVITSE